MANRGRGRPPKYSNAAELQTAVDAYFSSCRGTLRVDDNGRPVLDRRGRPVYDGRKPVTMSGLQLALGFKSRQSLHDYRGRQEFSDIIMRARLKVEAYTEARLFDQDGFSGARFLLQTAFNWGREGSQENRQAVPTVSIVPASPVSAKARKGPQEPF